jgi:tetratricopeptide (TPR) repeat protein
LFQRYLYAQLDVVRRAKLHEQVGRALEALHVEQRDEGASRLAYHFEAAGLDALAADYWLQAGQQAYRLSAPAESAALYRRGLALVEKLPASPERDRRELELLLNLETSLMTTRGWGAQERVASLQRAHTLARRLGQVSRLLPLLHALASVSIARAEHRAALDYAQELLSLAKVTSEQLYIAMGERMLGTGHFFLGHFAQARQHLGAGLRAYVALAPEGRASAYAVVAEEGVRLYVWLPHAWLVSGYPAQAEAYSQQALARAQALDYVGARAIALTTAGAAFYTACRRPEAALDYAEQLLALANKHALLPYQGWAMFYRGWALAYQGQPAVGLPEMHAGIDRLRATGTEGSLAHLFMLMAEVYAQVGEITEGERAIEQALALAQETGARSNLVEMYRVQGVLRQRRKQVEAAEASFTRAVCVAQEQSAKFWELRVTLALARLWQAQGQVDKAHARLAQVYDWFSEGFEMPDLSQARAFLDAPALKR